MTTQFDERPATVDRLLTREQIAELTVVEDLEAIQDEVLDAIKQIEVDLEFRADDRADDDWEHRARRALAAHHVCNTRIGQRIHQLRRGGKSAPTPPDHNAKARKKEAEAARLFAAAENKRAKEVQEREKTIRAMVAYADRQSFLAHFHRLARKAMGPEAFHALAAEARASLESAMVAELPAQGIVTAEADETRSGSVERSEIEPGPDRDAPVTPCNPEQNQ
jgi:hypothetical protein